MRFAAALLTLLTYVNATAAAEPGNVLATRQDRLIWLPTPTAPEPQYSGEDEYGGATREVTVGPDGGLSIVADYSVYDWSLEVRFRLNQEPGGSIDVEVEILASSGRLLRSQHYYADSYSAIADVKLITGDTVGGILATLADGMPPQDVDHLAARLSVETADSISWNTRFLIAVLDTADWRDRDAAASMLSRAHRLPEVRRALKSELLSDDQRRILEALVKAPAAGTALIAAVKQ